ncbi:MAG: hypothetical protein P8Y70_16640 [Candidatus Lokiarchaeota archaeon]
MKLELNKVARERLLSKFNSSKINQNILNYNKRSCELLKIYLNLPENIIRVISYLSLENWLQTNNLSLYEIDLFSIKKQAEILKDLYNLKYDYIEDLLKFPEEQKKILRNGIEKAYQKHIKLANDIINKSNKGRFF